MVFARPTSDGGAAVALFNGRGDTVKMTVDFTTVPKRDWSTTTKLKVRDMWAKDDIGDSTGSYSATVPSHGTVLIKLTAASEGVLL